MIRTTQRVFIAIFLITVVWLTTPGLASVNTDMKIISSSGNRLVFEYQPDSLVWSDVDINGRTFQKVWFDRGSVQNETGQPAIPVRTINLGIPEQGEITVQLLDAESLVLTDKELAPVPEYAQDDEGKVTEVYNQPADVRNLVYTPVAVGETRIFRQQRIATLIIQPIEYKPESKQVRLNTRMRIQVTFPSSGTTGTKLLRPGVDETAYESGLLNYEQAKAWRIAHTSTIIRKRASTLFTGDNWYKIKITGNGVTMKRDVDGDKEGMYKITGSALKDAGVDLSTIDPNTLQLFNNGGRELPAEISNTNPPDSLMENAILVAGASDGSFNESDYILFYGRSLEGAEWNETSKQMTHYFSHYDEKNVYWLTWGKQTGKRMQARSSAPIESADMQSSFQDIAWFEREEHNVYSSGTDWIDRPMSNTTTSRSYSLNLKDVVTADSTTIRAVIDLISTGSHKFMVTVNGNTVGSPSIAWYGLYSYKIFDVPLTNTGVLKNGTNTITIHYLNTQDSDLTYTDFVEVNYKRQFKAVSNQLVFWSPAKPVNAGYQVTGFTGTPEVYDITDFANVARINGTASSSQVSFADENSGDTPKKYITVTSGAYKSIDSGDIEKVELAGLRTPRNNVDYIIITYDDFEQPARTLESLRENWNQQDRLETEVVRISDVINEFGYGINDPGAIRDFLYYASKNWGNPYYVLLFGDGTFDYKNIKGINAPNLIPTYQSSEPSEHDTRTTDDWFVYINGQINGAQMAIGRICAQNVDEAQTVVNKIQEYETNPVYGDWRNLVTMVADDELGKGATGNEPQHTQQAENLSKITNLQMFNFKKIYLIEYRAVHTASISGITKPDARRDLLDQLNAGTLIVNYVGHGNDNVWAHEKVLYEPTDFDLIQNGQKQALWVAATCEFAWWDQLQEQSMAEDLLNVKGRGAIGMIATSRVVYSGPNYLFNRYFLSHLFEEYEDTGLTQRMGMSVLLAKQDIITNASRINTEKFLLLGDPAMRLGAPRYRLSIDDVSPDSIQALQKMSVTGHVMKGVNKWSDYQGKIMLRVMDSPKRMTYYTVEENTPINYDKPGNTLFRGTTSVKDGDFHLEFIVPKDISYDGLNGRVSLYFWNDDSEGNGYQSGLVVGGTATNLVDHEGPAMSLNFGDPDFSPGDYVPETPVLNVEITDSLSGVNTAGDIGHQIIMTLDDDIESAQDLTEYFEYNEGSYVRGTLKYPIQELKEGMHTIKVKAWDNSNNSGTVESEFQVVSNSELLLSDVLNYPNPMVDETNFTFHVSQEATAEIWIYTVAGRLIRKLEPMQTDVGFNMYPEKWDGRDQDGDKVANGVYLYKVKVSSTAGEKPQSTEEIGKLIIAR